MLLGTVRRKNLKKEGSFIIGLETLFFVILILKVVTFTGEPAEGSLKNNEGSS